MRRSVSIALSLYSWTTVGCATTTEPSYPNDGNRPPWVVPAPTVALRDRPEIADTPSDPTRRSTTVGDTTTVIGKHPLIKVDENGDPVTVTQYEPPYFVDDESYSPEVRCDAVVDNAGELKRQAALARADHTICIRDGEYRDWDIDLEAHGVENGPVKITAEHPGRVVLRGRVHIGVGGANIVLRGLRIEGGQAATEALIELRSKSAHGPIACESCRVSELVVRDVDAGSNRRTYWVVLFGQQNRIDHSVFFNKTNPGAMLVMWRPGDLPDNNLIDHNLFSHRQPQREGGEAIRLGDAADQRADSFVVVQDNLFEDLHGGRDIISSQSSAAAFLANTFRRCTGMLTLRHGDGAVVEANLFLTEHMRDGGGIRIVDGHHRVVNNYIEGVRTSDDETGGLVLMSYDKGYTAQGFQAVIHILIAHNTVIDSQQSLVAGGGHNRMPPKAILVLNNLFADPVGPVVRRLAGMVDWQVRSNIYSGGELGIEDNGGFSLVDPQLRRASDGLERPDENSGVLGAAEPLADVEEDMDGQTRADRRDVGADQTSGVWGLPRSPLQRGDVGPPDYEVTLP
jgi:poly(beta-D-mannuronate) lyase